MRKIISAALALAMAATSAVAFTGESEARRGDRYYDRGGHNHHYDRYDRHDRRHYRRHHRGGNEAAAAIAGLALGAIIVGSTQNGYRGSSHVERCERRYRSYDRRTDTFIGRDGREYYCRL